MKTLSQILLDVDNTQKQILSKAIDKTIPTGIIEKHIKLLKNYTPDAVISLVKINHMFKSLILSAVILVEDMLATGIYKSKFGNEKCRDILEMSDFFPKDSSCNHKEKFKHLLDKKRNKLNMIDMTLFEASSSQTLGGKILLIKLMDRDLVSTLITSKKTKYTKNELINTLETCKKLRNHIAHNFFVLNKGPYLRMVDERIIKKNNFSEEETIKHLFSILEKILKISSRGNILKKIKKEISEKIKNSDDPHVKLSHLDCLLLK